jgi:signal transduction histidine kinase
MEVSKDDLIASVSRAKAELNTVLENLERLHAFDPSGTRLVAHGLNNLLTVMFGTIDLLSLEVDGAISVQAQDHLQTLLQAAEKIQGLVRELFNSSTTFGPDYDFEMVNMNKMILFAVDHYSRVAGKKDVDLRIIEAEQSFDVWADRVGVAVILDNLLSNAVKYTRPGKKVEVSVKKEGQFGLCSVCDQGPGLTEEDLAMLFQAGVRLSALPTAGEPSTGYGLAVAKKVIDNMRGEIWCDTEYGRGSCFRFRLPTNPPMNDYQK